MSRYKHLADLLKICSVLPALAVMPAFAEDAVLNNDNLAQDNQIYSGTIEKQYATSTNRGGAVTIDYSTNDVSVADNAIFQKNEVKASTAGGAIKALNGFNIGNNVQFISNKASNGGAWGAGALYIKLANKDIASENTTVQIGENALFQNNIAGLGGAIGLEYGNLEIANGAQFINNEATSAGATHGGGAIIVWQDPEHPNMHSTLTLNNSIFQGNQAVHNGGAIAVFDTGATTTINGGQFTGNQVAKQFGGAIYNTGTMNIDGATFSGNRADVQGYGGAIFNANGLLTVNNATFDSNSAAWDGGAISGTTSYLNKNSLPADWDLGEWSVENVRKYWEQKNGFDAQNKIVVNDSTFNNNTVDSYSGGAMGIYSDAVINNSTFTNNNAGGHNPADSTDGGGAIYAGGWARIDITNSNFTGNSSNYGGAIATTRAGLVDDTYLKVSNSTFTGNEATVSGGAISNKFENTTINGTTFTNNTATVSGGAIYNEAKITFNGENVFSGNMAGGAANDIHNIGTMTVASGTTTLGGGITGNGALTIADGAVLNIGTTTVEQASIDIDGTLNASMLSSDNYGKLLADSITTGENGKLQLTIGSVGTYDIFGGIAHEDITIDAGLAYDVINNGADGIEIAIKAVEDIAADTGLSNQGAATIAVLANTDDDVLTAISLRAQTELAAGNVDYVEHETAKLNPENKPVAHSISSSVQNQVLSLAAGRMTGGTVGRSGGDLANADYGIWAQGLYNHSKLNGQFKGDTTGISVGADALIDGKYTIGIGYAYNDTDVDSDSRDTKIESNSLFLYGQYKPNNWYVNAALNYTMGNYTETSNPFGVQFESEYDVDSFGGQVMTGYDFASGLTPEIGARYLHISQDAYDVALGHVDGADMDYLTGVAGIRYAFEIESDMELKFRPELRAAATYDFLSDAAVATITAPGSVSYVIDADRLSRFGGEFGIGLAAEWRGLTVSLNYDLDLHEDYTSQTGMLKFRYDF